MIIPIGKWWNETPGLIPYPGPFSGPVSTADNYVSQG